MSLDTEAIRERYCRGLNYDALDVMEIMRLACSEIDELRYRLKGAHEKIRQLMSERDRAEDELRASKSQGAV